MPTMGQSDTTAGPITMDGTHTMTVSPNDVVVASGGRQGGVPSGYTNLVPLVRQFNNGAGEFIQQLAGGVQLGAGLIAIFASDGTLLPEGLALAANGLGQITGSNNTNLTVTYPNTPPVVTPGPTQPVSEPVTLPVDPPAGYGGGASPTAVAEAVWGFSEADHPTAYQVLLSWDDVCLASYSADGVALGGGAVGFVPGRGLTAGNVTYGDVAPNWGKLPPNFGESLLDYINRVSSVSSWSASPYGGVRVAAGSFPVIGGVGTYNIPQAAYDILYASVWYPPGVPQAVWEWVVADGGNTTPVGEMLRRVAQMAHIVAAQGFLTDNGFFKVLWADTVEPYPLTFTQPVFPVASIEATDTLASFLARVNPTYTVSGPDSAGVCELVPPGGGTDVIFLSTVSPWVFDRAQHYLYTPSSGPPERSLWGDLQTLFALIPVRFSD